MPGEVGGVVRPGVAGHGGQGRAGDPVELHAPGGGQAGLDGVADEGVDEAQRGGRVFRLGDEPGADGGVESAHHRDGRLARRLDEHGEVDAVALYRGQGEDLAGFLGETGQAPGDHVAHAVGDLEAAGGPGG